MTPDQDLRFLRRSFDVARRARDGGDHPFGCAAGRPRWRGLREQGNGYSAEGGDRTAHAERLLASWAAKTLDLDLLRRSRSTRSAEPCAMCAGALYWAGDRPGRLRAERDGAEGGAPARMTRTRRSTCPAGSCSRPGSGRRRSSGRCWRRRRRNCRRTTGRRARQEGGARRKQSPARRSATGLALASRAQ